MRKRRFVPITLLIALVTAIALSIGLSASVFASGRLLTTELTGAAEIPDADPDGSGVAKIWLNPGTETVCFDLTVQGVEPIAASHIHIGFSDVNGPVILGLTPPTSGHSSGCATLSRDKILAIMVAPNAFYVNVHNATYPGGALRGQLG